MAKDFIINTSGLNSYGTRVLTPGIDLTQYKRNPVLLYMHTRGFDGKSTPIGRVENIRVEGDELRGTPVFDMKDPFAAEIARKWEEDFIRMCSAGLEPVELSTATEYLLPGQSRATVVPCNYTSRAVKSCGWHRARTARSSRSSKTHTPRRRSLPRKRTTVTIKPFFR